jgi:hypothetical protein
MGNMKSPSFFTFVIGAALVFIGIGMKANSASFQQYCYVHRLFVDGHILDLEHRESVVGTGYETLSKTLLDDCCYCRSGIGWPAVSHHAPQSWQDH